ncbi:MAG: hypothetical protein HZB55_07170 [Deltaproteobacteria bacterium]|nr:hypothetical protein [Deltaproteobacteria bacterium]
MDTNHTTKIETLEKQRKVLFDFIQLLPDHLQAIQRQWKAGNTTEADKIISDTILESFKVSSEANGLSPKVF